MKLPGFNAEAALIRGRTAYVAAARPGSARSGSVVPARPRQSPMCRFLASACEGGSPDHCRWYFAECT